MALYTVVFTFRGTPFTRQVEASNVHDAVAFWSKNSNLPKEKVPNVSLESAVEKSSLLPANKLSKVWAMFLELGSDGIGNNENGVLTIIETSLEKEAFIGVSG